MESVRHDKLFLRPGMRVKPGASAACGREFPVPSSQFPVAEPEGSHPSLQLEAWGLQLLTKRIATLRYGVGAGTLKTSVRMAARMSGRRPRFCHFSSSTWASFASVGPEMVRPCERRKICRAKSR